MIRQLQYIALCLLLIGLVITFIPEQQEKTPEREFLDLAVACHMKYRPGIEQGLRARANIWKVDETCPGSHDQIITEFRSGAVHVLRSREHGYQLTFVPQVFGDEVQWSCESTVFTTSLDCNPGT